MHIYFFWKLPCFTTILRHKGKASLGELALFFLPHHPPSFSPKKIMNEFYFNNLLSLPLYLSNSWESSYIWKEIYAPVGDLTSFSKPAFWPIQIAYLCFQIYYVIIYLDSLLLDEFGWCTLIQYRIVLCSNFSLFFCEFCMFD